MRHVWHGIVVCREDDTYCRRLVQRGGIIVDSCSVHYDEDGNEVAKSALFLVAGK